MSSNATSRKIVQHMWCLPICMWCEQPTARGFKCSHMGMSLTKLFVCDWTQVLSWNKVVHMLTILIIYWWNCLPSVWTGNLLSILWSESPLYFSWPKKNGWYHMLTQMFADTPSNGLTSERMGQQSDRCFVINQLLPWGLPSPEHRLPRMVTLMIAGSRGYPLVEQGFLLSHVDLPEGVNNPFCEQLLMMVW